MVATGRVGAGAAAADGAGRVAECEVEATGKARLDVVVRSVSSVPAPVPEVVVVQALPKGDRGELAVEVLTELAAIRGEEQPAARLKPGSRKSPFGRLRDAFNPH